MVAKENSWCAQFSWSPRGVLLSQQNSATFLRDGEEVHIANRDLMAAAAPYHVKDGYAFVAYPNRDSRPFRDLYGIPEAQTFVRGSLRYEGNPVLVRALADLGWLDPAEKAWLGPGMTWARIQQRVTVASSGTEAELVSKVDELCTFRSPAEREQVLAGIRWIGLFSDDEAPVRDTLLDTISTRLYELCKFRPGERDLVMLQHKFVIEWEDGSTVSWGNIYKHYRIVKTQRGTDMRLHLERPDFDLGRVWRTRRLLRHVQAGRCHLWRRDPTGVGWASCLRQARGIRSLYGGCLQAPSGEAPC